LKFAESLDEVGQGLIPNKYENGRARGEEGLGSAMSGRDNQGKGGHHTRRMATKDDQAEKSEGWSRTKERGGKPQCRPKDTFVILMAKYKEGRAGVSHPEISISECEPFSPKKFKFSK
jgi:hypothetical protein